MVDQVSSRKDPVPELVAADAEEDPVGNQEVVERLAASASVLPPSHPTIRNSRWVAAEARVGKEIRAIKIRRIRALRAAI